MALVHLPTKIQFPHEPTEGHSDSMMHYAVNARSPEQRKRKAKRVTADEAAPQFGLPTDNQATDTACVFLGGYETDSF